MNNRKALRLATNAALWLFLVMTIGVVLWTADEMLDWNILPDWIDAFAQLLVIIMSILSGFAVIISIMCSFAVIAESSIERTSNPNDPPSRRTRVLVTACVLLALAVGVTLHKVDQHREAKRVVLQREEHRQRFLKDQGILQSRIPSILAAFTPDLRSQLKSLDSEQSEANLARLLNAIQRSTPLAPDITIIRKAEKPYRYQIISPLGRPTRSPDNAVTYLKYEDLIDLPSVWEHDTVAALFEGQQLTVPSGRSGAFIDTRKPSAWGLIQVDQSAVGIIMLRSQ